MAATKPPAFQFYAKDWLATGAELSLAEKGALADLMAYAWSEGSIPDDDAKIARLLRETPEGFAVVRDAVRARVQVGAPGRLIFPDLEKQRAEMEAYRAEQARKSALAAAARKAKAQSPADAPAGDSPDGAAEGPAGAPAGGPLRSASASASASPTSPAPREAAPAVAVAALRLEQEVPAAPKKKPPKAAAPPLAFRAAEALALVAEGAGDKFVPPDVVKRGHAIELEKVARRFPAAQQWRAFGAYLCETQSWRGALDVALVTQKAGEVMQAAVAWDEQGRPPLGQRREREPARVMSPESAAKIRRLF